MMVKNFSPWMAAALLLPAALAQTPDMAAQKAVLDKYCVSCHNDRAKTAGLALDKVDLTNPQANLELLEKLVRKLRAGAMPPVGMPKPDAASMNGLVTYLEASLDSNALQHPNPGRPVLHRMNRVEYTNAIRDLLGLKVDAASLLPSDNSSYGFDNVSAVLGMSPVLMERYLTASSKISRLATGNEGIREVVETYRTKSDLTQEDHIEGLPLGTRGGLLVNHYFPLDGEYMISVRLWRSATDGIRGLGEQQQFEMILDGTRIQLVTIGGKPGGGFGAPKGPEEDDKLQIRLRLKAGNHQIGATFLKKDSATANDILQPFLRSNINANDNASQAGVDSVLIRGPFSGTVPKDTAARKRVFVCYPKTSAEESPCAKRVLSNLATRAYRHPPGDKELQRLMAFYEAGRSTGDFESGIERGLRRILASPSFIYRVEGDPEYAPAGKPYQLSDVELASRLSFFLWSSIPDERLLTLATQGKLKDPKVLESETRRMLADPKAQALISNFFGQWLQLRRVDDVLPNPDLFPDFDDNLRTALKRETELLADAVVRDDRTILDFVNADYTFVNERLARHYGIPNVYGSQFRRVAVSNEDRRGLLGHGSILIVNSYATRTSPVRRGKWILETILGTPPPPPPPNVPPFPEQSGAGAKSVRAVMEEHRKNPACAACHKVMDPLGFGLENFNAVGAWRTSDSGQPIDPSGALPDGSAFNGPSSLRKALLSHPDSFAMNLAEKLMIYALGRGTEAYDMPSIRAITRDAAKENYRFSRIVLGIVQSSPFRMCLKAADGSENQLAQLKH
jgi:mono/diheme cytochrome c family protein